MIYNYRKFAYSGIAFPPRKSSSAGFFATAVDADIIKESIYVLLNTKKGEMPMLSEFGNSAYNLLFEPINSVTQGLIVDNIAADIKLWEPRVDIISIKASSYNNIRVFQIQLQLKATKELIDLEHSFDKLT